MSIQSEANRIEWEAQAAGVERKLLSPPAERGASIAMLVRLAPGASLPAPERGWSREWLLLEGDLKDATEPLGAGDYGFEPEGAVSQRTTTAGATLLVREVAAATGGQAAVCTRSGDSPWVPGHGNLRVRPLGTDGTALVHWPAGERFVPHQHFGGEEIYVLSGTFRDEHGSYPAGTWLRSPHLSVHHPFVDEETVIFVKTGHLLS